MPITKPKYDPVIVARNKLSGMYSHGRTPEPEALAAAQRDLTEAKLERYVREALAAVPPLTDEQRARIASLLLGR